MAYYFGHYIFRWCDLRRLRLGTRWTRRIPCIPYNRLATSRNSRNHKCKPSWIISIWLYCCRNRHRPLHSYRVREYKRLRLWAARFLWCDSNVSCFFGSRSLAREDTSQKSCKECQISEDFIAFKEDMEVSSPRVSTHKIICGLQNSSSLKCKKSS